MLSTVLQKCCLMSSFLKIRTLLSHHEIIHGNDVSLLWNYVWHRFILWMEILSGGLYCCHGGFCYLYVFIVRKMTFFCNFCNFSCTIYIYLLNNCMWLQYVPHTIYMFWGYSHEYRYIPWYKFLSFLTYY